MCGWSKQDTVAGGTSASLLVLADSSLCSKQLWSKTASVNSPMPLLLAVLYLNQAQEPRIQMPAYVSASACPGRYIRSSYKMVLVGISLHVGLRVPADAPQVLHHQSVTWEDEAEAEALPYICSKCMHACSTLSAQ